MGAIHYIRTVDVGSVQIKDLFLSRYTDMVESTIIPYQWRMINDDRKSGIIHNFRVAAGEIEGKHIGYVFQDEGLPKWLESAAYALAHHRNSEIEAWADRAIDLIAGAQQEDGYVFTYFQIEHPDKAFHNLLESHELVCLGNILEAGIAYRHATGKDKLLRVAIRLADCLCRNFGPDSPNPELVPGHPGIEFCLIKLYRETGCDRYLKLARHFIDTRGTNPKALEQQHDREWDLPNIFPTWHSFADYTYMQIHKPVREQDTAEGHTVRATYLYSGMADLYMETGDKSLLRACERIYNDLAGRRMYITGGVGSSECGERFTLDYDLPNDTVYNESCGSVGLALFCRRMFQATGDGKYLDTAERAIYNTVTGSIGLDGEHFFYVNPLEVWPAADKFNPSRRHVKTVRQDWYQVACCPQNTLRTLAGLDEYVWYVRDDTVYAGLYLGSRTNITVSGQAVSLHCETEYPFGNTIHYTLENDAQFTLALRRPGWSESFTVKVNGNEVAPDIRKGMAYLPGPWKAGDTVDISIGMPARLVSAPPKVRADAFKAALVKGPLVYCFEETDNGENLSAIQVSVNAPVEEVYEPDLLGGTLTLRLPGRRLTDRQWNETDLFKPLAPVFEELSLRAIPYCLWNNRGEGEMAVWIAVGIP